jgi:hypothetical protein
MSKIGYLIILCGAALAILTVVNIGDANVQQETKFMQVSVLALDQADYGIDENVSTIPAVSPAIIEDKIHDLTPPGSVKIIRYTTLPIENSGPAGEDIDHMQTVDQIIVFNEKEEDKIIKEWEKLEDKIIREEEKLEDKIIQEEEKDDKKDEKDIKEDKETKVKIK